MNHQWLFPALAFFNMLTEGCFLLGQWAFPSAVHAVFLSA
jgi:hypothetical protein